MYVEVGYRWVYLQNNARTPKKFVSNTNNVIWPIFKKFSKNSDCAAIFRPKFPKNEEIYQLYPLFLKIHEIKPFKTH